MSEIIVSKETYHDYLRRLNQTELYRDYLLAIRERR